MNVVETIRGSALLEATKDTASVLIVIGQC